MAVPGHLAPSYHSLAITHSLSLHLTPSSALPPFYVLSLCHSVHAPSGAITWCLQSQSLFSSLKRCLGFTHFFCPQISVLIFAVFAAIFCFFCGLQIECVFQIKSLKSGGNEGNYAVFEKCCVSDIDGIAFRGTLSTAHCVFCILWKAVFCR